MTPRRPRPNQIKSPRLIPAFCDNSLTAHSLHLRFPNLYIPSTFLRLNLCETESKGVFGGCGGGLCRFHVMDRDLVDRFGDDSPLESQTLRHHVKVMLVETRDSGEVRYLLGFKKNGSKEELVAVGGYWDSDQDGEDDEDLGVLVRTAIRTCRELTAIDLSKCSRWIRFIEFEYERGRELEKVTFLVPDVGSLMPSDREWQSLRDKYAKALARKIDSDDAVIVVDDANSGTIERAYDLSKVSKSILVHASRKAKSGTFFLKSRSLAHLLENSECTREQTFELFLFAQCVQGVMASSHARAIFNTLVRVKGLVAAAENGPKKRADQFGYLIENASPYSTRFPQLLLSLQFFDSLKKGFLRRDEMCAILSISGYLVSRSEIEAIVKRVLSEDRFYYRNLTDLTAKGEKMVEFDLEFGFEAYLNGLAQRKSRASEAVCAGSGDFVEFRNQIIDLATTLRRIETNDAELAEKTAEIARLTEELSRQQRVEKRLRTQVKEFRDLCEEQKERLEPGKKDDSYRDAFVRTKHAVKRLWEDVFGSGETEESK